VIVLAIFLTSLIFPIFDWSTCLIIEREEEHHIRKGKLFTTNEGNIKNSLVSCNYVLYDCYIILKNMYLFYEELH
jgi:hypothetical protein